jgi:4-amino-4-deoxy-L-arabinose transferase-like glycosyltransferase
MTGGGRALLVVAAAIVAFYLATRLSFVNRFPYFFDEGTYGDFTYRGSVALKDVWYSMTIGREPLQIWFGIVWVKLGFSPLMAMRIVALLSGLLTLPVLFLLGRRLADDWVGLAAAGLYAVLPFFVVHNGIGIMESLVVLIVATALLLQIDLARRPRLPLAAALGAVVAAGILTKENTKPALALIPLSLLCFDWDPRGRRERLVRWLQGIGIVAAIAVLADRVLTLSPYYDDFQRLRESLFYTTRKPADVIADPFASWGEAIDAYAPAFLEYVTVPMLVAFAVGTVIALRRRPRLTLVMLAWIALPLVISLSFTTLPYPRHVMYLLPPALPLMAYALVEGVRWIAARLPRRAAVAVSVVAGVLVFAQALRLDARVLAHPDTGPYPGLDQEQYVEQGGTVWPPAVEAIRSRARGPRVVILGLTSIPDTLRLMLGPSNERYVFVYGESPLAARAQLALVDRSNPFVDARAERLVREGRFVPVRRFRRPAGSQDVVLYERRD